jgi:SAM-dependent methyltransferase
MKLPSTMIYWTAILCVTFQTSVAYRPDGVKHKDYPVTLDRLQEQLSPAKTATTTPADPGPPNYWFHPKIHTFGNHGPLGAVHAALAPFVTKMIDVGAYNGENIRDHIAMDLRQKINKANARVVDLACGVGMSTRSLRKAFPKSSKLVGVDTSPQMIHMAKTYTDPQSIASKAIDMLSRALFHVNGITKLPNQAQEIAASSIEFTEANAEDTGLETGSFDLATIM